MTWTLASSIVANYRHRDRGGVVAPLRFTRQEPACPCSRVDANVSSDPFTLLHRTTTGLIGGDGNALASPDVSERDPTLKRRAWPSSVGSAREESLRRPLGERVAGVLVRRTPSIRCTRCRGANNDVWVPCPRAGEPTFLCRGPPAVRGARGPCDARAALARGVLPGGQCCDGAAGRVDRGVERRRE
jgi:hypothetical protein